MGELHCPVLSAPLISKNFVHGDADCNYENYLLEFVNNSIWFRDSHNNQSFVRPSKEDGGEYDCYSGDYGLDFKLILSQTYMQARRELSDQIVLLGGPGVTVTSTPRKESSSMNVTLLHAALREYDLDALTSMVKQRYKYGTVEYDVQAFLKTLETDKNILMFYPINFYFSEQYNFNYAINEIRNALLSDFRNALIYRVSKVPNKDAFLSFIYDDFIIMLQYKAEKLLIIDAVNTNKSAVYKRLSNYSW